MRKLPPVGIKLRYSELAAALRSGPEAEARLAEALQGRLACRCAFLFGSGRAALAAILSALRRFHPGHCVIVPAYTCWSVPAAVVRAGLRVVPAEMLPGQIDYDLERLARMDWTDVLAVISPNLFGLPGELTRLEGLVEGNDAVLIDDAAQALGASLRGQPVGSFGAAGLISFGRGKNITALGGGAALIRDEELASAMDQVADSFRSSPPPDSLNIALRGAAMRIALSPSWYGWAERLPGVEVGRTVYQPEFPTAAMGAPRAALAGRVLERLDEINQWRGQRAEMIDRRLADNRSIVLPKPRSGAVPAWLRRPFLPQDEGKKEILLSALQAAGIGASGMYPAPVHQIPGLGNELDLRGAPFAGAERLAQNLIVLPLVEEMSGPDFDAMARVITEVLGKKQAVRWV